MSTLFKHRHRSYVSIKWKERKYLSHKRLQPLCKDMADRRTCVALPQEGICQWLNDVRVAERNWEVRKGSLSLICPRSICILISVPCPVRIGGGLNMSTKSSTTKSMRQKGQDAMYVNFV